MSTSEPGLGRALEAFCLLTSAWLLLSILTFDYGRDQAIYAVVARSMLAGGMPYRDAWDRRLCVIPRLCAKVPPGRREPAAARTA